MHYYEVAPNKIVRAGSDTFTYSSDDSLSIGTIVEIEIGKTKSIGVILSASSKPVYEVKPIAGIVENIPLPKSLLSLVSWMSNYYHTPLAGCLQTILPRGVAKTRRNKGTPDRLESGERTNFLLNNDQLAVLQDLSSMKGTAILHGITGSGKTITYIEQAKRVLSNGKSTILLVPEIALTAQLVEEFSRHFDSVLVTHSKQTEAERHRLWQQALNSTTPLVVIGPRSALFMPVPNLGLIVIDECHEPSFQQEQSPRYSALRIASKYAEEIDGLALFGSATPLVSDYYLAKKTNRVLSLPKRARDNAVEPTIKLIDMTKRTNFKSHRFISDELIKQLTATFESGKQALIFHNRRGSASTTLCENCGWQAGCSRCYIPLTLHADSHRLRCHICNNTSRVPTSCPQCHHAEIIHKGIGTKQIETELIKLFPAAVIARFDADTVDAETVEKRYSDLKSGKINLIIGTQVIAKGLDLPELRTVGVVQADAGLSLPDYSSAERTFQLLAQVIGRVGRSEHATNVIIQSYQPNHPTIESGLKQDYAGFSSRTLNLRKHTTFPPFCYLLKLTCIYKTEKAAINQSKQLVEALRKPNFEIEILGPTPSFYERVRDTYRWQLVIKAKKRSELLKVVDQLPPAHWQFELDPLSLL